MRQLCVFLMLLLCAVVSITAQGLHVTKSDATTLVLNDILAEKVGKIDVYISTSPVSSKESLSLHNSKLTCPYSSNWVVFVDDCVFANWEHPCRYIFINSENMEYRIVNAKIFPENMKQFERISEIKLPVKKLPKINKGLMQASTQTATPNPHYYAVLLSGGINDDWNHIRYWNDLSAMYCTLTQVYGYMPENIYVHSTDGTAPHNHGSLDLDRVGPPYTNDINHPASKSSIGSTFQTLSNTIGPNDQLFIFVTGQGGWDELSDESNIALWGTETLASSELTQMLASIHTSDIITIMGQGHSGGFITESNPIIGPHTDVQTAAGYEQTSWAEVWITNALYDEFVYYWTAAARGYYPGENAWDQGDATGSFPFNSYFSSHPVDYNPDTNADGVVQMQEAFNYANDFDTWSSNGYYEPSSENNWEDPVPSHDVGFQEDLLSLSGLSGTVTGSQTVSGNFLVNGNLNIQSGASVTISPSSKFYFSSEANLSSQGQLHAGNSSGQSVTFTSVSGSTEDWGSLILSGSGASGSSLDNIVISSGTEIQVTNVPNFTVENSAIQNMIYGINCSNSTGTIASNTISNPRDHGIIAASGSNLTCAYNSISKSDHSGAGIYFGGGSYGDFYHNQISGFNWGVGSIWGSSPVFWNPYLDNVNNHITNCLLGLEVYQSSGITLSTTDPYIEEAPYYSYSGIHGNSWNVDVQTYSFVDAYFNFWGSSDEFSWDNTSSFIWDPPLDYCPYCNPQSAMQGNRYLSEQASLSGKSPRANVTTQTPQGSLEIGRKLKKEKRYSEALKYFAQMVQRNEEPVEAVLEIYTMEKDGVRKDVIATLQQLSSTTTPIIKHLLAVLSIKNGDIAAAKRINEEIIASNPIGPDSRHAILQLVYIALYQEKDTERAKMLLSTISSEKDAANDIEVSLAQHALKSAGSSGNMNAINSPSKLASHPEEVTKALPLEFNLSANYPNPFNPTTRIQFALPVNSFVTLRVYDVLGKEVATLVNEEKLAGYHNVQFDASRHSSGMYIYQFQAGKYHNVKKMLLVK